MKIRPFPLSYLSQKTKPALPKPRVVEEELKRWSKKERFYFLGPLATLHFSSTDHSLFSAYLD